MSRTLLPAPTKLRNSAAFTPYFQGGIVAHLMARIMAGLMAGFTMGYTMSYILGFMMGLPVTLVLLFLPAWAWESRPTADLIPTAASTAVDTQTTKKPLVSVADSLAAAALVARAREHAAADRHHAAVDDYLAALSLDIRLVETIAEGIALKRPGRLEPP